MERFFVSYKSYVRMVGLGIRVCMASWLTMICVSSAVAQQGEEPGPQVSEASETSRAGEGYGATARVREPVAPSTALQLGMASDEIPGTFGDPFRIMESMPGAVPMVSGVPYVYVRGAPPSGNAYDYDGIPLPQLFHLGLGPATIHPSMLGELTFEPGAGTARFGRRVGALMAAGAPDRPQEAKLSVEARLLDANLAFAVPGQDRFIAAAGRFGYPGLIAPALGLGLEFSYWDYQLRVTQMISSVDRIELVALGSGDDLSDAKAVGASVGFDQDNQALSMGFHRLDLRLERRLANMRLGMALRLGYDHTVIGSEVRARAETFSPRIWFKKKFPGGHRIEAGLDMQATSGAIRELPRQAAFDEVALQAVTRNTSGAYAEATLRTAVDWQFRLGGRVDVWAVGEHVTPSLDPRIKVTWFALEQVSFHVGAGLAHQPVVLAFPLPAFTDVALDRGLQQAMQSELGMRWELPEDVHLEANLFAHRYRDLLLPEVFLRSVPGEEDRVSAYSYGAELFLRRQGNHALTGFVSYTLGRAQARESSGRSFSPEFDVRHVLNLVAKLRLVAGLSLSLGAHLRSGKPANQFTDSGVEPDYALRLPAFMRLDARLAYVFGLGPAAMQVYVEMLNSTLSTEAVDAECYFGSCRTVRAQAVWFPNLGIRAEL